MTPPPPAPAKERMGCPEALCVLRFAHFGDHRNINGGYWRTITPPPAPGDMTAGLFTCSRCGMECSCIFHVGGIPVCGDCLVGAGPKSTAHRAENGDTPDAARPPLPTPFPPAPETCPYCDRSMADFAHGVGICGGKYGSPPPPPVGERMSEGEFEVAADFALRCARPVNERSLVKLLVAEARRAREAEARWMHAYQDASDGTTEARADKAETHAKELYEEQLDAAKRYKAEIDEETKRADKAEADLKAALQRETRLREALDDRGEHHSICVWAIDRDSGIDPRNWRKCDCGLEAVLAGGGK